MSDDFHRPTYTNPGDVHGAYNATQVRLYGIQGPGFDAEVLRKISGEEGKDVKESLKGEGHIDVVTGLLDDKYAVAFIARQLLSGSNAAFIANAMRKGFGGVFKPTDSSFVFIRSVMEKYMIMLSAIDLGAERELTSGVIFGYSYEGHCYDLPKPKIMLIPSLPQPIPADDCAFDRKIPAGYLVWIVDKLDQCVEFEVNQGFVEQLVLEANLPGKRSPAMYAGKMLMAHRSGRLSE